MVRLFELLSLVSTIVHAYAATTSASPRGTLQFTKTGNVTRVTFNHPPINLVDTDLVEDWYAYMQSLIPENRKTPPPKVVIFDSSNPDYFLSHINISSIIPPFPENKIDFTNKYVAITRYLSNITPTIFIAEINGRAFGAGQELAVQMDMRFAGPSASTGSFENALGLVAGGGGQLFLGPLIGRGRALEYLLAAKAFDGPTGAALGLFNKYYPSAKELKDGVHALASRIGRFPAAGLNETKAALNFLNPSVEVLNQDVANFYVIDPLAAEQKMAGKFLAASENQSNSEFERGLPESILTDLY